MTTAKFSFRDRCSKLIRESRERQGLTLLDVASAAGLRKQYVSDCEHGLRNVGLDNLERILIALGIIAEAADASSGMRSRFAANMRALRERKGLSQEALAADAGVHRTFVSMVERGVRNISLDNVERLAGALKAEEESLVGIP